MQAQNASPKCKPKVWRCKPKIQAQLNVVLPVISQTENSLWKNE